MSDRKLKLAKAKLALARARGEAPAGPPPEPSLEDRVGAAFEPTTKLGTATRGLLQGASMEFGDEIAGASAAATGLVNRFGAALLQTPPGRALMRRVLGDSSGVMSDEMVDAVTAQAAKATREEYLGGDTAAEAYASNRDAARAENEAAIKANPKLSLASRIAGGALTSTAGPLAVSKYKPGISTFAGRAQEYAQQGAKLGALTGLGTSTNDDLPGALADMSRGAQQGAVIGGVAGPTVEGLAVRMPAWLRQAAERKAEEAAMGGAAPMGDWLRKEGLKPGDVGRVLVKRGVVGPFRGAAGMAEKLGSKMDVEGKAITSGLQAADDAVAAGRAAAPDMDLVASQAGGSMMAAAEEGTQVLAASKMAPRIQEAIDAQQFGTRAGTFEGLRRLKSGLQDSLKPMELSRVEDSMYRAGVRGVTRSMYDQMEGAVGPAASEEFKAAMGAYREMAPVQNILERAASRAAQRKTVGLSDYLNGQMSTEALRPFLGPLAGPVATGVSAAFGGGRGAGTMAWGLSTASKAVPQTLQRAAPYGVPGAVVGRVSQSIDEKEREAADAFVAGNGG